jgi:hypothetical protein
MEGCRDEIQILENHQDAKVQGHIQNKNRFCGCFVFSAMLNPARKQVIEADGGHHHENESRLAPGIEKQTGDQKPVIAELPGKQKIDSVSNRKEQKKKLNTGKEHKPGFSSFGIGIGIQPVSIFSCRLCSFCSGGLCQAMISDSEKEYT